MDIYELRRQRLRQAIDDLYEGVVLRCAEAIGKKPPQLHRWLSVTSKDRRRIEYDSARTLETDMGLPALWLDQGTDKKVTVTDSASQNASAIGYARKAAWPFKRITRERYMSLRPEERSAIEERLEVWIEAYEAAAAKDQAKASR